MLRIVTIHELATLIASHREWLIGAEDGRCADLTGADLTGARLTRADLTGARLTGADLTGADIPVVPNIDAAMLAAVESNPNAFDMNAWHHPCSTSHCRAGWAIVLAGDKGAALEKQIGPAAAGALIYAISRPTLPVPDFYASNTAALADIKACAATT